MESGARPHLTLTDTLADDPENAIESRQPQIENREKSIRDKIRNFLNRTD